MIASDFCKFSGALCLILVVAPVDAQSVAPPITAITFTPDGRHIIAGSQAGLIMAESATGNEVKRIDVGMDNIHDVEFSPDRKTLAIVGGNPADTGAIEILAWPSLESKQSLLLHDDVIFTIDFAADGSFFVVASADEVCSVIATGDKRPKKRFTRHSRGVMSALILPDLETIVSGSRDETLRVWKAIDGENIRTLHNHSGDVVALAVKNPSTGLPMVASASSDLTVRFWQPTIGRMVRFARLPSEPLCIAWCDDGKLIAGSRDGKAYLIDAQSVKIQRTLAIADSWIYCVAVDPNNDRQLAFGSNNGQIRLIDLATP